MFGWNEVPLAIEGCKSRLKDAQWVRVADANGKEEIDKTELKKSKLGEQETREVRRGELKPKEKEVHKQEKKIREGLGQ